METASKIAELNRRFGIPGLAEVVAGNGGLPKVSITSPAAAGEMYLHGAHVTSWKPGGAGEVLFLSSHSRWQDGKAIRGGIPICFPWFRAKSDDPHAPAHGFVRTNRGSLRLSRSMEMRFPSVCLPKAMTAQSDGGQRTFVSFIVRPSEQNCSSNLR